MLDPVAFSACPDLINASDDTALFDSRNFLADPVTAEAGDLSTEGLLLIPANNSPTRTPLLVASNEISGTTTVFEVQVR